MPFGNSPFLRVHRREEHSGSAKMPAPSILGHCSTGGTPGGVPRPVSGQLEATGTASTRPCLVSAISVASPGPEYAGAPGPAVAKPKLKPWLIDLPTEILLLIGDFLPDLHTLSCLARTHRRLTDIFSTILFSKALKGQDGLSGQYLLCLAAQLGNCPLMLLLLDRYQIDVDAVSIYRQRTALHSASEYGQLSTAKLLLQRGASPDAQDFEGTTPLHLATGKRSKALIILLIENGANTELENHAHHTPLHYATKLNDPAILRLLLVMGSNPNRIMGEGSKPPVEENIYYQYAPVKYTALHIAVTSVDHPEAVIRELVEFGADLEARNPFLTPLGIVARRLLENRALWIKFTNPIWHKLLQLFELLLEFDADFESAMESVDADTCNDLFPWLRQAAISKFHKDLQAVYDRVRAKGAITRIPRIWFRHRVIESLYDTDMRKFFWLMSHSEPVYAVDEKSAQYGKCQAMTLTAVRQWRRRTMAELTSVTKVAERLLR